MKQAKAKNADLDKELDELINEDDDLKHLHKGNNSDGK